MAPPPLCRPPLRLPTPWPHVFPCTDDDKRYRREALPKPSADEKEQYNSKALKTLANGGNGRSSLRSKSGMGVVVVVVGVVVVASGEVSRDGSTVLKEATLLWPVLWACGFM